MKNLFFVLVLATFLSSNLLAQDKLSEQASLDRVQALIDQNEAKAKQVESLESLYYRLSAEVVLVDAMIDEMLNPTNIRTLSCTADCGGFEVVCTSQTACAAVDGVGCALRDSDGSIETLLCEDEVLL